jgi:hypothetical protein
MSDAEKPKKESILKNTFGVEPEKLDDETKKEESPKKEDSPKKEEESPKKEEDPPAKLEEPVKEDLKEEPPKEE